MNTPSENMSSERPWQAQWIWPRGHAWTVNFHGLARREFTRDGPAQEAVLRISAYADYTVWVNGALIGRGPEPCDPWFQTYDAHDITPHLRPGVNVVAVRVHNYGIGVHWHNRGRGGLIAQLDIAAPGGPCVIATNEGWRVCRAAEYAPNNPRTFWSADFLETFDFRRHDPDWLQPGFDEGGWETPEVIGPPGTRPWPRLTARDIPLLREEWQRPVSAEQGRFTPPPLQAVSFAPLLPPGRRGLVHALAVFSANAADKVRLHVECDDAFKLFLNGDWSPSRITANTSPAPASGAARTSTIRFTTAWGTAATSPTSRFGRARTA